MKRDAPVCRPVLALCAAALFAVPALAGCSRDEEGADPHQESPGNTEGARSAGKAPGEATVAANGEAPRIQSISDNPAFFEAIEMAPTSQVAQDLDSVMRPVLVQVFGEAKVVSVGEPARYSQGMSGDVLGYAVRRYIDEGDGELVHQALRAAGASRSPRLGTKPVHSRKTQIILMSLFKRANGRHYHLCIVLDLQRQSVHAGIFIPDPKLDSM